MPSGSGSGIVHSKTDTPSAAGRLVVVVTFDSQISVGSDWGSGVRSSAFCTQNGNTVYGELIPTSTTRQSQALRAVFDVVAGLSCEYGLYATLSGAVTGNWWNVNVAAELIKR